MKNNKKKTKKVIIIITALVLTGLVIGSTVVYYKYRSQKLEPTSELTQQESNPKDRGSTETSQSTATSNPSSPSQPAITTPAPPAKPTFTKSSGNNGPVPSGAVINFTCVAELNVDCSIILTSNGKQTVLGPTKVTDNGRGQYFANFYWTAVKGSYQATAQAKNAQGGVSASNPQALEVQ